MPLEPITVFVVDDDDAVRKSLTRMLVTFGYRVLAAATAAEFFRLVVNAPHPSCVILDIRLPDSDGLEVQQRMLSEGIEIPIVFITGHGDIPMSVKAMKAGALDFLSKPYLPRDLLAAVHNALARDRHESSQRGEVKRILSLKAKLTTREREVMDCVVAGLTNKEIADRLRLVVQTVKVHRGRMMTKMGVSSLAGLIRLADPNTNFSHSP